MNTLKRIKAWHLHAANQKASSTPKAIRNMKRFRRHDREAVRKAEQNERWDTTMAILAFRLQARHTQPNYLFWAGPKHLQVIPVEERRHQIVVHAFPKPVPYVPGQIHDCELKITHHTYRRERFFQTVEFKENGVKLIRIMKGWYVYVEYRAANPTPEEFKAAVTNILPNRLSVVEIPLKRFSMWGFVAWMERRRQFRIEHTKPVFRHSKRSHKRQKNKYGVKYPEHLRKFQLLTDIPEVEVKLQYEKMNQNASLWHDPSTKETA